MVIDTSELFKDFENKKEEKEKTKADKGDIEIRIRLSKKWFNKLFLERAIFIVIILILSALVLYNPFGKYRCEKGLSDIRAEPVASEKQDASAGEPDEPVIETEPVAAEKKDVSANKPIIETEPEKPSEPVLSGKATVDIQDILLDTNKTKVESVTIKIDNQKKILTPMIYVYWYDESTEAVVKSKPNGGKFNYTGAIPIGTIKVWKLDDELKNRLLRTDDITQETFKVEMYDASDSSALDEVTKIIST